MPGLGHYRAVFTILLRVFKQPHRQHVTALLAAVAAVVLIGAWLFSLAESLPFTTGLYWAVTTATTVGYGDVTPHNPVGRLIASLVMLTTIPMLAAAFAIVSGAAAAAGIRRVLAMHSQFPEGTYRLIIGMNPIVPTLIDELESAGIPVVLVADVDPESVRGVHVVRGDPTEEATIAKARPAGAEQALITGNSDGDVLVSAVMLRKQAPSLTVTALVSSPSVREALRDLGIPQSVSASELVSRTLAASLETPHAGEMIAALVGSRDVLAEIEAPAAAVGTRLSALRSERDGLVLGLVRSGEFTLGIGDDPVVESGDRLLVAEATRSA
jgi:voltage-gated potassium channel